LGASGPLHRWWTIDGPLYNPTEKVSKHIDNSCSARLDFLKPGGKLWRVVLRQVASVPKCLFAGFLQQQAAGGGSAG
jgi:hypothetical protein